MDRVRVDMFEVQLGAALLIQTRTANGVVRILADAGVDRGIEPERVQQKLRPAMAAFEAGEPRIDLMVGTHYDRDHLAGLVPIIRDTGISIGQVWLPPVRVDATPPASPATPSRAFLGEYLATGGTDALAAYLSRKELECNSYAAEWRATEPDLQLDFDRAIGQRQPNQWLDVFETYLERATAVLGDPLILDSGADGSTALEILGYARIPAYRRRKSRPWRLAEAAVKASLDAVSTTPTAALALLIAGSASDAINAIALNEVVVALRERGLHASYETIPDGAPRTYAWDPAASAFVHSTREAATEPALTLLGPSQGLVEKHAARLPVGQYLLAAREAFIPVKGITPSNQLSYVFRVDAASQRILVTGDAGMVDFVRGTSQWHSRLINEVGNLNVVQVAHHAGNNGRFYHALLRAPGREEDRDEFLLLSHATQDLHRPSPAFESFLEARVGGKQRLRLLFTSAPTAPKVAAYTGLFEPVVGPASDRGDVCIAYAEDEWSVRAHAIAARDLR